MKKSRFTEEQIAFALKQAETGTPVAEVIRRMGLDAAVRAARTETAGAYTVDVAGNVLETYRADDDGGDGYISEIEILRGDLSRVLHDDTRDGVEYVFGDRIAGLFFLQRGNLNLGFLLFAISCLTKWQPLIIAPFVCLYVLGNAKQRAVDKSSKLQTQIIPFALAAGIVGLPLFLIFGWKIFDSLHRAMTYHIFLSAYGLNLSWIHTWILHLAQPEKYGALQNGVIDIFQTRDFSVIWPEKILFYLTYAILLIAFVRQRKTFERLIVYSILGYMAYFVFNTSVHENHLFLVCCLGWILAFIDSGQLVRCINLSIAANANLFLFYGVFGQRLNPVIAGLDITILFAVANICLFAGMLLHTFKADGVTWRLWQASTAR